MRAGCKVKICGVTNVEDARLAVKEGADYIGVVVEVGFSPRSLTVAGAIPVFAAVDIPVVALVFNMAPEKIEKMVRSLEPYAVQFLSPDGPALAQRLRNFRPELKIWQSLHFPAGCIKEPGIELEDFKKKARECVEAGLDAVIFDTYAVIDGVARFGGTGLAGDWQKTASLLKEIPLPAFLAGGLNPGNVKKAIETVRPYGIDLCSGVEEYPGKKSPSKIKALMEEVKMVP